MIVYETRDGKRFMRVETARRQEMLLSAIEAARRVVPQPRKVIPQVEVVPYRSPQ